MIIFIFIWTTSVLQLHAQHQDIWITHTGNYKLTENTQKLQKIFFELDHKASVEFTHWDIDSNADFIYLIEGKGFSERVLGIYSPDAPVQKWILEKGKTYTLIYTTDALNMGGSFAFSVSPLENAPAHWKPEQKNNAKNDNAQIMSNGCDACPPSLTASAQNPTICEGECTFLNAEAKFFSTINDDFNSPAPNTNLWDFTNGVLNQSCGSLDGTNTMWFGSSSPQRFAATKKLNTLGACNMSFDLKFGTDPDAQTSGCEDADLPTENVQLQYFNGTDWITFETFDNNGLAPNGPNDTWNKKCVSLPTDAQKAEMKFRWLQNEHSGSGFDQWALDNISIDIALTPKYRWQGPVIFQGDTTNKPAVCPTATSTYTVTATAGSQSLTTTVDVEVIPRSSIGGQITTTNDIACPGTRPEVMTLQNYRGVIQLWQYSPGCTGIYQPIANTAVTYAAPIINETTCYRAVVQFGSCLAFSDSIKIRVPSTERGRVLIDKDTVCAGESVHVTLTDYVGDIIGWEYSSDGSGWNLDNTNTQESFDYIPQNKKNCFRAVIKYRGCADSTAVRSDFKCFERILNIDASPIITTPVPWYECHDSIYALRVIGLQPGQVVRWEVKKNGQPDWEPIAGTNNTVDYISPVTLKEFDCYRIIYDPLPPQGGNQCPTPPVEPLQPFCIRINECDSSCNINGTLVCQNTVLETPICRYGTKCGTDVKWEIAYDPPGLNCALQSLIWHLLPDSEVVGDCAKPVKPIDKPICLRAIYKVRSNPDEYLTTPTALIDIEAARDNGTADGNPLNVCTGINSGRIRIIGYDTLLHIDRWEFKPSNAPADQWQTLQIGGGNEYNYANLTENTTFRAILKEQGSLCEVISDTVKITVFPETAAGVLKGGKVVCPDKTGTWLNLENYVGTPVRWEKSIGSCNGPWVTAFVSPITDYFTRNLTQSTCFRVIIQSGVCPERASTEALVDIQPPPIGGQVLGSTAVCAGLPGPDLTLAGTNGTPVRWESSTDCVGFTNPTTIDNTTSTLSIPPLQENTCYRVVVTNGGCESNSGQAAVIVTAQTLPGKLSGINRVCFGNNTNLTLSESTGDIVRWEKSTDEINWTSINNTTNQYATEALTQRTCYRVFVKSTTCPEAPTNPFCVIVDSNAIGGVMPADTNVCTGQSAGKIKLKNYNATVLQWEVDDNCTGNWVLIPNTASDEYDSPIANNPVCYRALVVRFANCPNVYSPTFRINVTSPTVAGSLSPNHTICINDPSELMTLTGYTGTIIGWEKGAGVLGPWTPIPNTAGLDSYTDPMVSRTSAYRVRVKNGNCPEQISTTIVVTCRQPDPVGVVDQSQTICENQPAQDLVLSGNRGAVLFWEKSESCNNIWTTIPNTTQTLSPGALTATTCYRAVVNGGICPQARTSPVRIEVEKAVVGGTLTGGQDLCDFSATLTLTLNNYVGNIIRWEKSEDNGQNWTLVNNTQPTYNATVSQPTIFRVVLGSPICGEVLSTTTEIKIAPPAVGGRVIADRTICFGGRSGILEATGFNGTIERWEISKDDGATWTNLGKAGVSAYQSGGLTVNTWFRVLVSNGGCGTAYSQPVKITVTQRPIAGQLEGTATICDITASPKLKLINYTGDIVVWESSIDNGQTWQPLPNTSDTFQDNLITQTKWYRVLVTNNSSCAPVYSAIAKVTMSQPSVGGNLNSDKTICMGNNSGTMRLDNNIGRVIYWEISKDGTTWKNIGKSGLTSYRSGKLTVTSWFRAVVQSENCPIAYSTPVKITVLPPPIAGQLTADTKTACDKATPKLELHNFIGTIAEWQSSHDSLNWTSVPERLSVYQPQISQTTYFRVKVINGGCGERYSNVVKIIVSPKPNAGTVSPDATVCFGFPSAVMRIQNFSGQILRWEISKDSTNWVSIGKAGFGTYQSGKLTVTTWFRVVLGTAYCESITSHPIKMTVLRYNPYINVGTVQGTDSVCMGKSTSLRLLNAVGNVSHWEYSLDNWTNIIRIDDGSANIIFNNLSGTTKIRAVMQTPCGDSKSNDFTINAILPPALTATVSPSCDAGGTVIGKPVAQSVTFRLQPDVAPPNQTGIFTNVPFGNYQLYATNSQGCNTIVPVVVAPQPPDPPVISDVNPVTQTTAMVRWTPVYGNNVRYVFRYKIHNSPNWTTIGDLTDTLLFLRNLEAYTFYDVEVAALCTPTSTDTTDWSTGVIKGFKTDYLSDDCLKKPIPIPTGMYVDEIGATKAKVHWNYVRNAPGYIVSYGLSHINPSAWAQYVVCNPDTSFIMQSMAPLQTYRVRIRTNCTNCTTALKATDNRSNWNEHIEFKTIGIRLEGSNVTALSAILIYPNPNNGTFEIQYSANKSQSVNIELMDILGKNVWKQTLQTQTGNNSWQIGQLNLPKGMYLLQIKDDSDSKASFIHKLVIE